MSWTRVDVVTGILFLFGVVQFIATCVELFLFGLHSASGLIAFVPAIIPLVLAYYMFERKLLVFWVTVMYSVLYVFVSSSSLYAGGPRSFAFLYQYGGLDEVSFFYVLPQIITILTFVLFIAILLLLYPREVIQEFK